MNLRKFLKELKRRKVYQVALTYGITSWLVAQILDLATDAFNAPDWVMQMAIVVLLIGFPVALILAWAYELSPQGIIRTDSEQAAENPFTPAERRPMINKVVIILLIVIIGYLLTSRSSLFGTESKEEMPGIAAPNSIPIAVLPLKNLSEDPDLDYFSNGVTLDLINELGKVRSFAVTDFLTVYGYQNSEKNTKIIAEELGVTYLMQGFARAFAGRDSIQIDIGLIDPYSQRQIWSITYKELMDQAPALQSSIARKVASSLNIHLSKDEFNSLAVGRTTKGPAYLKFMEARNEFYRLQPNRMARIVSLLEEAIALDPSYAQAHTFLAWVMVLQGWPEWKVDQELLQSYRSRIVEHLNIARELDPSSSDIRLVQANYEAIYLGDLKMAVDMVDEAIELNSWPELPTSLCICTAVSVNVIKGNNDKAKGLAGIAKRVEPGNIMLLFDQFIINLLETNLEAAERNINEALSLMDVPLFRSLLGIIYYHQERYQEAQEVLAAAYRGQGYTPPRVMAYLSNTYYKLGNLEKNNIYRDSLEVMLASGETQVLDDLATVAAVQGEDDLALSFLERQQEEGVTSPAYLMNVDPVFKKYYQNPRFVEMRRKMNYYD